MSAASEKRIGIAYLLLADTKPTDSTEHMNWKKEGRKAYEASREFYREALETEPQIIGSLPNFFP